MFDPQSQVLVMIALPGNKHYRQVQKPRLYKGSHQTEKSGKTGKYKVVRENQGSFSSPKSQGTFCLNVDYLEIKMFLFSSRNVMIIISCSK